MKKITNSSIKPVAANLLLVRKGEPNYGTITQVRPLNAKK